MVRIRLAQTAALIIGAFRWSLRPFQSVGEGEEATTKYQTLPTPTGRARYHHFRPVHHLRHFVGNDGMLWVYSTRPEESPFQKRPSEIGGENFLYAPEEGPDPKTDEVERWLASQIDGPAAEPLRKLINGRPLDNSERSRISSYLAVQDMRTPTARDLLVGLFSDGVKDWYRVYREDPRSVQLDIWKTQGRWLSLDEVSQYLGEYDVEVGKGVWLDFLMTQVNKAAERLHQMRWHRIPVRGSHDLLTNDIGIVKCQEGFDAPVAYRLGLVGASHWIFPLSPRTVLLLAPPFDARAFKVGRGWVRKINRQLVRDAYRHVYASRRSDFVQEWAKNGI